MKKIIYILILDSSLLTLSRQIRLRKFLLIFLILFSYLTGSNCYAQWYKQQIPVNKPVTGIKFVDTLNGWASTGDFLDTSAQNTGCILHTTNGGANWLIQLSKSRFAFSTMTMVNNTTGYAFGDSLGYLVGTVEFLKTTNGGINWFNMPIPNTMWISRFYFQSPDTGWETDNAASSPDARLTTDGGYTWQQRTNGMTGYPTVGVNFINYNTGFCGSGGQVYKSTNAGLNWNLIYDFSQQINSIFFLNENSGWCGFSNYFLRHTSNGGLNWVNQTLPPTAGTVNEILFLNEFTGYAGDGYDKILKTTNSGVNWGYQVDTGGSVHITFIDTSHVWTSPNFSGYVDNTTNGGGFITYVGIINISNEIPEEYELFQNYPNPFNPNTRIRFSLIKPAYAQIKIYDSAGKEINPWIFGWYPETLLEAGTHEFRFNANNLASGVYFYQLTVTGREGKEVFRQTRKMLLIK